MVLRRIEYRIPREVVCESHKQPVFIVIAARNHRNSIEFAAGKSRADCLCKQCSIHERIQGEWLLCDHRRGGHGTQTRSRLARASNTIGNHGTRGYTFAACRFPLRQCNDVGKVVLEFEIRSAFRYRPTEQARCEGRCELCIDTWSARRLAKYGYSIWIAAKARDVPANPLERELLIHQPIVAIEMSFGVYRGLGKESQIT